MTERYFHNWSEILPYIDIIRGGYLLFNVVYQWIDATDLSPAREELHLRWKARPEFRKDEFLEWFHALVMHRDRTNVILRLEKERGEGMMRMAERECKENFEAWVADPSEDDRLVKEYIHRQFKNRICQITHYAGRSRRRWSLARRPARGEGQIKNDLRYFSKHPADDLTQLAYHDALDLLVDRTVSWARSYPVKEVIRQLVPRYTRPFDRKNELLVSRLVVTGLLDEAYPYTRWGQFRTRLYPYFFDLENA